MIVKVSGNVWLDKSTKLCGWDVTTPCFEEHTERVELMHLMRDDSDDRLITTQNLTRKGNRDLLKSVVELFPGDNFIGRYPNIQVSGEGIARKRGAIHGHELDVIRNCYTAT